MDENTKFLLERIDKLEDRVMNEIRDLQGFKAKVMGVAAVVSIAVSGLFQAILKKF